jgi:DNA-binding response OmpR family regulator
MTSPPIVVVDRHAARCAEVCASLAADGLTVTAAGSKRTAGDLLATLQPRLLIVGVPVPCDLPSLCADLRCWANVPILLLLDPQPKAQIIALLECGADDYLLIPFTPDELRARVQDLLRRVGDGAGLLHVGDGELAVHLQTRTVRVRGAWLALTSTEHELLLRLARQAGTVLTYAELLAGADPLYATDPGYLAMYIWHLRQKLERNPRQPRLLLTVAEVGYRLLP